MGEVRWTPQQNTAISERGRSMIVSAAAGSGKTAVLVERLVQILSSRESRVRSEDIVVVTFTNDAAAQMKQRLYQALNDKMSALDSDANEEDYLWLLEQQSGLSNAKISTINAFCFDLIRENADICGISSQFRIAEPSEEVIYERQAMQTVLEHWNRTRIQDMETLFSFFCTRDDSELEGVILAIAEYMKSLAFAEHWSSAVLELCGNREEAFREIRNAVCNSLTETLGILEKSVPFAESVMLSGKVNKFLELLSEDRTNIQLHLNYLKTADMDKLLENPLKYVVKFSDFSRVSKNADPEKKAIFKQFREIYKEKYKSAVSAYLNPLAFFEEDLHIQKQIIPLLLALTQDFRTELFEEKKRRNVLCFDDGERLALSLLGDMMEDGSICRSTIGDRLADQYSLIMVDEYQDCNNKQDCLFKLLSKGCTSTENGLYYGKNAFLVGDVKQSIYSFRQANPRNFMQALFDSTPLAECRGDETARIYLNRNFRSSEGVINFVNGICSKLMTLQCGEVLYDENEYLYFGAEQYVNAEHTRTAFLLTEEETPTDEEHDVQAECVAAHIAKMLAERVPVMQRDGTLRPCEPKDFCILLRSVKKHADGFIGAFKKWNIPVFGEESFEYLERPEIRLAYNYLRIIDNPLTDISMANVLFSEIYGFTAQDLTELKIVTKRRRIYLQIHAYLADEVHEQQLLYGKCHAFMSQFEKIRSMAESMSLEHFIQYLYDETDLLSLQSLYEDDQLRRCNLQTFRQLSADYREHAELNAQGSIADWLRYLDSVAEKGLEVGGLPQAAENCVAIKTIHKSKGLEYPFIILAHPEITFSNQPAKSLFHTNEKGLLGLRVIDRENFSKSTTAVYQYLLAEIFRRQRSEEMRLFYVALTRAQQQLILVADRSECRKYCLGAWDTKSKAEEILMMARLLEHCPSAVPSLSAEADSMLEWILMYLLSEDTASILSAIDDGKNCTSSYAEYIVCNAAQPEAEPEAELIRNTSSVDEAMLEKMQQQLAFHYDSKQKDLVSKYSVTMLAHPEQEFSLRLSEPSFLHESRTADSLRGAQKGTAVHKMLQYMDFASAANDPQAEIERLLNAGYLTELESQTLTKNKLFAFFESELYHRIAASDNVQKEKQVFVQIGELDLPKDSPLHQKYVNTDGILIGTMDLLFKEDDGWVLVDYKTDAKKTAEQLEEHYRLQLGLYRKAAERILGEPVKEAYIYSFTLDTVIAVDLRNVQF